MSNHGSSHRQPLEVRVFGGTISCDEHVVDDPRKRGGKKRVLLPARGRIRRLLECAVSRREMNKVDIVEYSEADPIIDSAELNTDLLMESVADIRERTKRKANILIASGTDNVVYLMHALAEGVRPEVLGDNNIIVVVSQTPAPPVSAGMEVSSALTDCEAVANLNNAIYLSTIDDMRGRIGLYCGGVLFPPRGLMKMDTKDPQPFRCRFRRIGISEKPPQRDWHISTREPEDVPRGKLHDYELADGVESWGFDPLSNYGNLPAAMEGMIRRKQGGGIMGKPKKKTDFNAMVVQAPGSSNLRQSEEELAHVNEAAEIGLEANVPVVLISDPLQPHSSGEGGEREDSGLIYGGDLALMREHLDRAAGGGGRSPVLSGGKLARPEAKLLVSQAVRRGVQQHGLHGKALLQYVQTALADYESFLSGK